MTVRTVSPDAGPFDVQLEEALLSIDRAGVDAALASAVTAGGLSPSEIADQVIAPALERIGDGWERGRVALSQVYMSGRLLEAAISRWAEPVVRMRRSPVIGAAVLEDHHSLGKRILVSVLRAAGRDVHDLGTGLSAPDLVDRAAEADIEILMVSVLMIHRALHVKEVRTLLDAHGMGRVRLIVGGAPFVHDPELWRRVGADAMGRSAADALRLVRSWDGGAP
ncbi:MAG: cobalamin-dependent protein [Pseudomonadota bacterium]